MAPTAEELIKEERSSRPKEGTLTRKTDNITARAPSLFYLAAAIASMVVSASAFLMGKDRLSMFIGQWAPSILILGLYNKLVKELGSD